MVVCTKQYSDGQCSTVASWQSVGQSLKLVRVGKPVWNESVRSVALGPKVNDLWVASHCAWSHALVLLDLRKITKDHMVNGPDSIRFWVLPHKNNYLRLLYRQEYLSVTWFPLNSCIYHQPPSRYDLFLDVYALLWCQFEQKTERSNLKYVSVLVAATIWVNRMIVYSRVGLLFATVTR